MSKPRSEEDLSNILYSDFNFRLKELSDLKRAIQDAQALERGVLLKSLVALAYAHWEGHVKYSAQKYFEYLTMRRLSFAELERQFYVNSFLLRLNALSTNKASLKERCDLVERILDSGNERFAFINPELVNTGSNLNSEIIRDLCIICGIDGSAFEEKKTFIDVVLLKRRNSIAHGDHSVVKIDEVDSLIDDTLSLMRSFRNLLENKIVNKTYLAR